MRLFSDEAWQQLLCQLQIYQNYTEVVTRSMSAPQHLYDCAVFSTFPTLRLLRLRKASNTLIITVMIVF